MPEWGVTGTVYLQQITSHAFTAQSSLAVSRPQPERHLASSRTTTSSYSPLPYWVRSSCASVYITASQQAWGQPGSNYLWPGLPKLAGLHSGQSRHRGSIPGKGKQFYCFPKRPDRIWGRPTFLFTGYRALNTHLHIVLSFRNSGCSSTPLMCRHDREATLLFFYLSRFFSVATQTLYLTHPNFTIS